MLRLKNVRKGSRLVFFGRQSRSLSNIELKVKSRDKRGHKSVCKICYNSLSSYWLSTKRKRCLEIPFKQWSKIWINHLGFLCSAQACTARLFFSFSFDYFISTIFYSRNRQKISLSFWQMLLLYKASKKADLLVACVTLMIWRWACDHDWKS